MKTVLWTLLATFVVVIAGGLLIMYGGTFSVAALSPRGGPVEWVLSTTMDHSVHAHATGITVPDLNDSSLIDLGFDHYKEMCITCHGSPAGGQSEAGIGLNPQAPELSDATRDWTPPELYWIVKNGVKMTGMPAFAPTHSERELWAIVAFLQKLKTMTPTEYKGFDSARKGIEERQRRDESPQSSPQHDMQE